jgi:O-6-methylguanine DNA methyltransferase
MNTDRFTLASALGPLLGRVEGEALVELSFDSPDPPQPPSTPAGRSIHDRLVAYLGGALDALETIAVAPQGTPFQVAVWSELRKIPVGETISYAQLARAIGRPSAVRAVAGANGRNPVAIVIPCHRVIGADGTLTGYGGGLDRKRWLLGHEVKRNFSLVSPRSMC